MIWLYTLAALAVIYMLLGLAKIMIDSCQPIHRRPGYLIERRPIMILICWLTWPLGVVANWGTSRYERRSEAEYQRRLKEQPGHLNDDDF